MNDLVGFVTSSENFYKFSFLAGLFMVVFGFVYPIEKRQDLDLLKVQYEEEFRKLSQDIKNLEKKEGALKEMNLARQRLLNRDSLVKDKVKDSLNLEIKERATLIQKEIEQLKYAHIELSTREKIVKVLQRQITEFVRWQYFLVGLGLLLSLNGGIQWWRMSRKDLKNKLDN